MGRAACLLNDEPVGVYVPLLMRPWVVQACRSTASCHLGTTRILRMLERLLMDWYEYLYPVVASPLPEVPSKENLAGDGPLARHLDAPARRAWHCR